MKKRLPQLAEHLTSNALYKGVALFVAFAIWMTTLYGRKDITIRSPIDVELITRPGFIVEKMDESSIVAQLKGPRNQLKRFRQTNQPLKVDLTNASPGEVTYPIDPRSLSLPDGVKVIRITPDKLKIKMRELNK